MDDATRYEAMYRLTYPTVLRYCQRRTGWDAARDAAAEVFLVAWRRFDDVPDPALPWLLRTASLTLRTGDRGDSRQVRLVARLAECEPRRASPDHADAVAQSEQAPRRSAGT